MTNSTATFSRRSRNTSPEINTALDILSDAVGNALNWIRDRREMRRAIKKLDGLDDHLLADIGVNRSEIDKSLRRAYRAARRSGARH